MGGVSRIDGSPLSAWGHVVQSVDVIFTTRFGERVQREWFGSDVPKLLGENATVDTFVNFYSAVLRGLTVREINGWLREPRLRITHFEVEEVSRTGEAKIILTGIFIPRALYGDMKPEGTRTITITASGIAGVL